jgi:hypothetical protein
MMGWMDVICGFIIVTFACTWQLEFGYVENVKIVSQMLHANSKVERFFGWDFLFQIS